MVEFSIDNIQYVEFGGNVYQQTVGIPMGTNCVLFVADLLLYSYETVQHLQKSKLKKQTKNPFNITIHYIYNVLSLINPKLNYYIDVICP